MDKPAKIPKELLTAFEPLTKAMENWEAEIFKSLNSLIRDINHIGRGYSFEALRAKILFTEGLAKQRKPKYQRRIDKYELEEYLPVFKMTPVIRELEEVTLLGIDISTLIEKLEKGEL